MQSAEKKNNRSHGFIPHSYCVLHASRATFSSCKQTAFNPNRRAPSFQLVNKPPSAQASSILSFITHSTTSISLNFPMDGRWCTSCGQFRAVSDFVPSGNGKMRKTCSKHAKNSQKKRPIDLQLDDWDDFISEIRAWKMLVRLLVWLIVAS